MADDNPYVIFLHATNGPATSFDFQYVQRYDPHYEHPDGYDGGILVTTHDPNDALRFATSLEAFELYRLSHGTRPDGHPNRPLTAWTIEVLPLSMARREYWRRGPQSETKSKASGKEEEASA